jgi:hypothetical protein
MIHSEQGKGDNILQGLGLWLGQKAWDEEHLVTPRTWNQYAGWQPTSYGTKLIRVEGWKGSIVPQSCGLWPGTSGVPHPKSVSLCGNSFLTIRPCGLWTQALLPERELTCCWVLMCWILSTDLSALGMEPESKSQDVTIHGALSPRPDTHRCQLPE